MAAFQTRTCRLAEMYKTCMFAEMYGAFMFAEMYGAIAEHSQMSEQNNFGICSIQVVQFSQYLLMFF